ncbi:hypothetical protein TNCV_2957341 [Trichonephila clavipes]|nr:hypothetical protein TNCV_2957341 [Trichonephila clavipes]
MREHLIDSWPKFKKLVEKLDEFESVQSGIKTNSENKNIKFANYCDESRNYSRSNFKSYNRNSNRLESNESEKGTPPPHNVLGLVCAESPKS